MENELKINVADKGIRFGNHLLDLIGFYFLIFLHAMVFDAWLGVVPEEGSDLFVVYFFIFFVAYHLLF